MTATDRARFFAGEYDPMPKSRMPLRDRAQYSDRVSVYRLTAWLDTYARIRLATAWNVTLPGNDAEVEHVAFTTFDEAIHEAHRLAKVRAERDQPSGEHPPIATVQALMQAAWS